MDGEGGRRRCDSAHAVLRQGAGHALPATVLCQERCHDGLRRGASMQALKISLIQGATRWHDAPANREYYGELVRRVAGQTDLVVLPETFLSGFSNDTRASADTMEGEGVAW